MRACKRHSRGLAHRVVGEDDGRSTAAGALGAARGLSPYVDVLHSLCEIWCEVLRVRSQNLSNECTYKGNAPSLSARSLLLTGMLSAFSLSQFS